MRMTSALPKQCVCLWSEVITHGLEAHRESPQSGSEIREFWVNVCGDSGKRNEINALSKAMSPYGKGDYHARYSEGNCPVRFRSSFDLFVVLTLTTSRRRTTIQRFVVARRS